MTVSYRCYTCGATFRRSEEPAGCPRCKSSFFIEQGPQMHRKVEMKIHPRDRSRVPLRRGRVVAY